MQLCIQQYSYRSLIIFTSFNLTPAWVPASWPLRNSGSHSIDCRMASSASEMSTSGIQTGAPPRERKDPITDDLRVVSIKPLIAPAVLHEDVSQTTLHVVYQRCNTRWRRFRY